MGRLRRGDVGQGKRVAITGGEAGQAAVELALVLPLMVLILLIIVDFGRVFTTYVAVANAAREGARYCALHPGDTAGTQSRVRGESDGRVILDTAGTVCATESDGDSVTVTARATFTPITPFISNLTGQTITVQAPATMVRDSL